MQEFRIASISDLERLSHQVKWQWFEKLVAFVFEENGFEARQNVVVQFGGTKRQFDVLAERYGEVWAVECKKQQRLAISHTMDRHAERCAILAESIGKDVRPLIVTLNDEVPEAPVPIVPLMKLNAWINEA